MEVLIDGNGTAPDVEGAATPVRGHAIGRYLLLSQLGAGAMGIVYAAYDPELDRKVALKLLKHQGGDVAASRKRLQREAQALAKLDHPNVVSVHDVGVHKDRLFVAREYVAGQTLGSWMAEAKALPQASGRRPSAGQEQVLRARPWREVLEASCKPGGDLAAPLRSCATCCARDSSCSRCCASPVGARCLRSTTVSREPHPRTCSGAGDFVSDPAKFFAGVTVVSDPDDIAPKFSVQIS